MEDLKRHEETVKGMLLALEEVGCAFCKGWGHKAKSCATLKAMNLKVKDIPGLKGAWGKLKSTYLQSAHKNIAMKALSGRKRTLKLLGK
jgi:hypothetical protein